MDNENKLIELVEKSISMSEASLKLADAILQEKKDERKSYLIIIITILCTLGIVGVITIYGYFFSSYDYYELPAIENTNTNTNTNGE